jgi:hypothetical protein
VTPDPAACARTAVDRARTGLLTTYARHPSRSHTAVVQLAPDPDGAVQLHLPAAAVPARQLLARPVATLSLRPPACEPTVLHGAVTRLRGTTEEGALVFRLEVAAGRVGAPARFVDGEAYARADPDPLRQEAPGVLAHLNGAHADGLADCLRAAGHDLSYAVATRLDAHGLTVAAVGGCGVSSVRLAFPRRIERLEELPPSLLCALTPRCECASPHRTGPGAP